jgi:hypothetical protein
LTARIHHLTVERLQGVQNLWKGASPVRVFTTWKRTAAAAFLAAGAAGAAIAPGIGAFAAGGSKPASTSFPLFPAKAELPCLQVSGGPKPSVQAVVTRGNLNDTLRLSLANFKPGLAFDLFTVQRSNQNADGTARVIPNFGLAWYQSDVHIGPNGRGSVKVKTILLDQIFGFDPDVALTPTNTFHMGFWFNNPADAAQCGFTGTTPFNGEHNAGPLAFITRPNAVTDLGPLCTDPNTSTTPATCNP